MFPALTSAPPKTRQKAALGSATARAGNNGIPQLIRGNSFFIVDVTSSIGNLPEEILAIVQPMTKTQLQGVGQNKLPKWANPACQSHVTHFQASISTPRCLWKYILLSLHDQSYGYRKKQL